jgi:hypothetical protein
MFETHYLRVNKIDFDTPLRIISKPDGVITQPEGVDNEVIYRFNFTVNGWPSNTYYIGFYCFDDNFTKDKKLDDKDLLRIIEGEVFKIDRVKFYSWESARHPTYGDIKYLYHKDYYEGWNKDRYFNKWFAINSLYDFTKPPLHFVDLNFGRLFHWQNLKNIKIELPFSPYTLHKF